MASASAIAIRRSLAQRRLAEESKRMADSRKLELPPHPPRSKDIGIAAAQELEEVADFLKAVNDADGAPPIPQPEPPKPKEKPAPPAPAALEEESDEDEDKPHRRTTATRRHR